MISGEVDSDKRWSWEEFRALPSETVTVDIHCVTKWSKLDTTWTGVSLDVLLDGVETAAEYAVALSYGGYTTNLPLEDLTDGKAWIAYEYGGGAPERAHRGGAAASGSPLLFLSGGSTRPRVSPAHPAQ